MSRLLTSGWCSLRHIYTNRSSAISLSLKGSRTQSHPTASSSHKQTTWPDQVFRRGFTSSLEFTRENPNTGSVSAGPSDEQETFMGQPKLLVFGGSGFVGSRVCEEALKTGLPVVSVNRSGSPKLSADWVSNVEWIQADVFDVGSWRDQLQGAVGVISCLGAFGSNDFMQKICGDSNITVFEEAAKAGVPRAAFISVHDYNLPGAMLPGYFQGKRRAEEALALKFPGSGVALRPGFIYGTRQVGGVGIPLGAIGYPLDKVLGVLPAKSLAGVPVLGLGFVPPISASAVGRAAVAAATDPSVPAGILDIWQMKSYEA
ncbi:hypothetical protein CVIRNUC_003053 [Coccomyxa viridis]|uniref:NAD(P)-binding domain-containing protein n=1 Tax=Coccomyxa viridis TaxID=1274662 RepID=A0AAV1I1X5_9CHLO|nr:hypothetical protein CVIRNUC_003053 [Coccomyxa viridis]